ncbi:unnamed protein product [Vitrella brassicaformis CCMP3155]|uniref:non-specific serine/threonine protein kinase n=4 Tax=Vitrella brassicaformis TaxID=1169539 RepID=A0A0G4FA00_VITBC|nr:unnamed protein product [Vitrella brassicaformis CCMP3155]|eukprot:CEM09741.1 unnamed protein product [Vitrella brassicaformis CCMP3155]
MSEADEGGWLEVKTRRNKKKRNKTKQDKHSHAHIKASQRDASLSYSVSPSEGEHKHRQQRGGRRDNEERDEDDSVEWEFDLKIEEEEEEEQEKDQEPVMTPAQLRECRQIQQNELEALNSIFMDDIKLQEAGLLGRPTHDDEEDDDLICFEDESNPPSIPSAPSSPTDSTSLNVKYTVRCRPQHSSSIGRNEEVFADIIVTYTPSYPLVAPRLEVGAVGGISKEGEDQLKKALEQWIKHWRGHECIYDITLGASELLDKFQAPTPAPLWDEMQARVELKQQRRQEEQEAQQKGAQDDEIEMHALKGQKLEEEVLRYHAKVQAQRARAHSMSGSSPSDSAATSDFEEYSDTAEGPSPQQNRHAHASDPHTPHKRHTPQHAPQQPFSEGERDDKSDHEWVGEDEDHDDQMETFELQAPEWSTWNRPGRRVRATSEGADGLLSQIPPPSPHAVQSPRGSPLPPSGLLKSQKARPHGHHHAQFAPLPPPQITIEGDEKKPGREQKMVVRGERPVPPPSAAQNHAAVYSRYRSDFEELRVLGTGAFGVVTKVRHRIDRRAYAVKRIQLSPHDEELNRRTLQEAALLPRLQHVYVVRYYAAWLESSTSPGDKLPPGVSTLGVGVADWISSESPSMLGRGPHDDKGKGVGDKKGIGGREGEGGGKGGKEGNAAAAMESKTYLYIQMEFCGGRTLREAIDSGQMAKDRDLCWQIFRQLLEALLHIHHRGMIHRDLKPSNIFLDKSNNVKQTPSRSNSQTITITVAKEGGGPSTKDTATRAAAAAVQASVSDVLSQQQRLSSGVGTMFYQAPEQRESNTYDQKVDIFSLGVIFFEMLHPPFTTLMERALVLTALCTRLEYPRGFVDTAGDDAVAMLTQLLQQDPSHRPSVSELLRSPLVPPSVEQQQLRSVLNVLSNPFSSESVGLMSMLFAPPETHVAQAKDKAYWKFFQAPSRVELVVREEISHNLEEIFRRRGAVRSFVPVLQPVTETTADLQALRSFADRPSSTTAASAAAAAAESSSSVLSPSWAPMHHSAAILKSRQQVIDASNTLLHLPFQLTQCFARTAPMVMASSSHSVLRRYAILPVYREPPPQPRAPELPGAFAEEYSEYGYPKEHLAAMYEVLLGPSELFTSDALVPTVPSRNTTQMDSSSESHADDHRQLITAEQRALILLQAEVVETLVEALSAHAATLGRVELRWTNGHLLEAFLEETCRFPRDRVPEVIKWLRHSTSTPTYTQLKEKLQSILPSTASVKLPAQYLTRVLHRRGSTEDLLSEIESLSRSSHDHAMHDTLPPLPPSHRTHPHLTHRKPSSTAQSSPRTSGGEVKEKESSVPRVLLLCAQIRLFLEVCSLLEVRQRVDLTFDLLLDFDAWLYDETFAFFGTVSGGDIIASGGRYDQLIDRLQKGRLGRSYNMSEWPRLSAIGFEIALEKVIRAAMQAESRPRHARPRKGQGGRLAQTYRYSDANAPQVIIVFLRDESSLLFGAMHLAKELRKLGIRAEFRLTPVSQSGDVYEKAKLNTVVQWLVLLKHKQTSTLAQQREGGDLRYVLKPCKRAGEGGAGEGVEPMSNKQDDRREFDSCQDTVNFLVHHTRHPKAITYW